MFRLCSIFAAGALLLAQPTPAFAAPQFDAGQLHTAASQTAPAEPAPIEIVRVDADPLLPDDRAANDDGAPFADDATPFGGNPNAFLLAPFHLPADGAPVVIRVNPVNPSIDTASAAAAIGRAAATWTSDPDSTVTLTVGATSPATSAADRMTADGYHDIFWAPAEPGGTYLARTTIFLDADNLVVEFNVQLNSAFHWVDGAALGYDIESVVLHELGHPLGFEHVSDPGVVMQPSLSLGAAARDLGVGDRSALLAVHGLRCGGLTATMIGTAGDDDLMGTVTADIVVLGAGSDSFEGRGGDDVICAGTGDDTIYGNAGSDHLAGDDGDDNLWGGPGADTLLGNRGADVGHGGSDDDMVRGGSGDDVLDGGPGRDRLRGGPDDDVLWGATGDDDLRGSWGDDTLFGERGFDDLFGGPGDDTLVGGRAGDELAGQSGDDRRDGGGGTDACDAVDDTQPASTCELRL